MNPGTKIEFSLNQVREAAIFVATLIRECIRFGIQTDEYGIEITITGF